MADRFAPGLTGLLQNIALQKLQERSRERDPMRQLELLQLQQQIQQKAEAFPLTKRAQQEKIKADIAGEKRKKKEFPISIRKARAGAEQADIILQQQEIELDKTARTQEEEVKRFQEKERFLTDERIRLKEVPSIIKHLSTDKATGKTTFPAIPENTRQAMMSQMFEQIKTELGQVKGEGFLGFFGLDKGTGVIEEEDLNEMLNTGNFPPGLTPRAVTLINSYKLMRDRADIPARMSNAPTEVQEVLKGTLSALALTGKQPQGLTEQEQINIQAHIDDGISKEKATQIELDRRKK
ncbi:hypothetical protein LCGC14_0351380 [marine sediment metagenome]|uniref:Uncharacterized protein n=1 Tax=marine sediment metagenome TaxID=412755 RepID=A0A0F9TG95_9ZZZZ